MSRPSTMDRAAWFLRRHAPARAALYLLMYAAIAAGVSLVLAAVGR